MPFIPVENTVQIELVYLQENQIIENVLHYIGQTPANSATLTNLAMDAFSAWTNTFRTKQDNTCVLTKIIATDISAKDLVQVVYVPEENNAGIQVGTPLPLNNALCITLRTARRGRGYRGRIYMPGVVEESADGSYWDTNLLNAIPGMYADWDFLSDEGDPWAQGVAHRYEDGQPLTLGTCENVLSWDPNPVVASQRRRLPGRGT